MRHIALNRTPPVDAVINLVVGAGCAARYHCGFDHDTLARLRHVKEETDGGYRQGFF